MSKSDDDALKIMLAVGLWVIGSGVVGGFLHNLSASTAMDFVIIAFVLVWGGFLIWVYNKT